MLLPVAMDFIDPDHGWVAAWTVDQSGESSRVFATSDGGETWTLTGARGDFNNLVTAVDFVDAQHGWVAGEGVWSTSDGGATWKREVARLGYLAGVGAADATHVYAGAEGWGIVSTVDASGDTAPPVTLSEGARGWLRRATSISLAARDVGGSGVAGTEYRLTPAPGRRTRRHRSRRPRTTGRRPPSGLAAAAPRAGRRARAGCGGATRR